MGAQSPVAEDGRRWRGLVIVLLVALTARLLALWQFSSVDRLIGDENYYIQTAYSIVLGEGHPGSVRPPLYPFFIAGSLTTLGDHLEGVRCLQIVLSLLSVFFIHDIARQRFGSRAALFAGLLCAISPALVHYCHFLWSEGLTAMLLAWFLWLLHRFDRGKSRRTLFLAGLVLGLTALTRDSWLFFTPVICIWIWRQSERPRQEAFVPMLLFVAAVAVPVLPWCLRNTSLHGRPVMIATNHWLPMGVGNIYPEDGWHLEDTSGSAERAAIKKAAPPLSDEFACQAYWKEIALERIGARQPLWILEKLIRNIPRLFYLNSQQLRFVMQGNVDVSLASRNALIVTDVVGTLIVFLSGFAGLWLVEDRRLKAVVVVAVFFLVAIHVVANATPRFHVPLIPLLAVYGGALLSGRVARSRVRALLWWGAAVTAVVYLLLPLPLNIWFFGDLLSTLAQRG